MKNRIAHLIAIVLAVGFLLPPDPSSGRAVGFSPVTVQAGAGSLAAPARTSGTVTVTLTASGFQPT